MVVERTGLLASGHFARATSHATPEATIAGLSKKIGAKTKASFVVAECGSRSSGVKNPTAEKNIFTSAVKHCKVIETTIRSLDLSNAVAIMSRLSVDGMQFRAFVWHVIEHWFVAGAHTDVAQLNNVPRRGRRRCGSEQRLCHRLRCDSRNLFVFRRSGNACIASFRSLFVNAHSRVDFFGRQLA